LEVVPVSKTSNLGNAIGKVVLAAVLLVFIGASILYVTWPSGPVAQFTTAQFGALLFGQYGVVVVVLGLLLFGSMIAGVFIAQEEDQ
jgi:NADH:ubiquinone oxidoreductase subunit 6 (subunit J)